MLLEKSLAQLPSIGFAGLALTCIAGLLDTGLVHNREHTELCHMVI